MRKRALGAAWIGAVTVAVVGGVAIASSTTGQDTSPVASVPGTTLEADALPPPEPTLPAGTGVPQSLADAYAVLRRVRTGADALPADAVQALGPTGAAPELSRRVGLGSRQAYVVPSGRGVCLVVDGPYVCTTTEVALSAGLGSVQYCPPGRSGSIELSGLVRDGVDAVTVDLADGTTQTVPVTSNVYAADVPRSPTPLRLRWVGADGQERSQPVVLPPGGLEAVTC